MLIYISHYLFLVFDFSVFIALDFAQLNALKMLATFFVLLILQSNFVSLGAFLFGGGGGSCGSNSFLKFSKREPHKIHKFYEF